MIRDIKIHAVLNAFVVNVGCQTVVFDSIESLAGSIEAYLRFPENTETDWRAGAINARHTLNGAEGVNEVTRQICTDDRGATDKGQVDKPSRPNCR